MKDRLRELLQYLNVSIEVFAIKVSVSPDLIRKYLRGYFEISETFLRKLVTAYPEVNIDWLRTGDGQMINKSEKLVAFEPETDYSKKDAMMAEKDNIIKEYKEIIQQQRNIIEHLSKLKNVKTDLDLDFQ